MSRGVRRKYVGPVSPIVTLLDGREVTVERGQVVDVSKEQADRLDVMEGMWEPESGPADVKPRELPAEEAGEPAASIPPDLS